MWNKVASIILRNRITLLAIVGLLTIGMGYFVTEVKPLKKMGNFLPEDHPVQVSYQTFLEQYGHDGTVFVVGVQTEDLYQLDVFNDWRKLGENIKKIDGIDSVFSVANLYALSRDDSLRKFGLEKLQVNEPQNQVELDSLKDRITQLPFYDQILYNDSSGVHLMMVFVNGDKFNSENRGFEIDSTTLLANEFGQIHNLDVRYSGMPYIRTIFSSRVEQELGKFLVLAFVVTALILFMFFRSLKVTMFSMLVVSIGMVFSLGMIGLFGYKLSMLMGLIPPLMTVIGVPNCVYLLNKYQSEYRNHGNKVKALRRVIEKVGNATFMTNTTTALGFATFIFTESAPLKEFGVITSICIMVVFLLSILLIPIIFSYLPGPKEKQTRHLEQRWLKTVVESLVTLATSRRKSVYAVTILIILAGFYGLTLITTTGNMVDDLPADDPILEDLHFFEDNFNGVMPFEVLVDVREKGWVTKADNLEKVESLQRLLREYPEFSRSLCIVDAIKFAHQSFYTTYPTSKYALPNDTNSSRNIRSQLGRYIKNTFSDSESNQNDFVDSTLQTTRITASMADVGTIKMDSIITHITPRIDSIFNPERGRTDSLVAAITRGGISQPEKDSLIRELYSSSRIRRFVRKAYQKQNSADSTFADMLLDYPDTIYAMANEAGYNEFIAGVVEDQYECCVPGRNQLSGSQPVH